MNWNEAKGGDVKPSGWILEYNGRHVTEQYSCSGGRFNGDTHWMPFPEPPYPPIKDDNSHLDILFEPMAEGLRELQKERDRKRYLELSQK